MNDERCFERARAASRERLRERQATLHAEVDRAWTHLRRVAPWLGVGLAAAAGAAAGRAYATPPAPTPSRRSLLAALPWPSIGRLLSALLAAPTRSEGPKP